VVDDASRAAHEDDDAEAHSHGDRRARRPRRQQDERGMIARPRRTRRLDDDGRAPARRKLQPPLRHADHCGTRKDACAPTQAQREARGRHIDDRDPRAAIRDVQLSRLPRRDDEPGGGDGERDGRSRGHRAITVNVTVAA
jgi:hypothetical protein